MRRIRTLITLFAGLALLACQQSEAPSDQNPAADDNSSFLGAYVQGFNLLGESGQRIQACLKQDKPSSLHAELQPRLEQADQALAAAKKLRPEALASMDAKASGLQETTRTLLETYEKTLKAEPTDSAARAKALAGPRKAWLQALQSFGKSLESLEDETMAAEVAARAGKKDYGYWFRFFNVEAKHMVKAAQTGRTEGSAALEKALAGLKDFSRGQAENINPHFAKYVDQAQRLGEASRAWAQSPDESKRRIIDTRFNELIELGNGLYKLEARGTLH